MSSFIEITNLSKTYYRGENKIEALKEVNITIQQGDFIGIVGRSGSGKSTLMHLLGGLDTIQAGKIIVDKLDLSQLNRKELAQFRLRKIGMIFQAFNLIKSYSAIDNVALALAFGGHKKSVRKQIAQKLLNQIGLSERGEHLPGELSGGEAQRVAITRAIANKPLLLLADEPTGNLDSQTSDSILLLLKQLNEQQNMTIVMVTHDLEMAQSACNKIIRLKDGQVVEFIDILA